MGKIDYLLNSQEIFQCVGCDSNGITGGVKRRWRQLISVKITLLAFEYVFGRERLQMEDLAFQFSVTKFYFIPCPYDGVHSLQERIEGTSEEEEEEEGR